MKLTLSLLLLSLLVFSGCTGGSGGGDKIKDVFIIALENDPTDLYPTRSSGGVDRQVYGQHYKYASAIAESLLFHNLETGEFRPNLAKKWEVSEDGLTFTFYLRDDVKFHDGSMMTAQDVKFTFDSIFDDKHEAYVKRSLMQNFSSPEIVDDYTIRFKAKKKYFLNLEQLGTMYVMPKKTYSKIDPKNNRMAKISVGSGPYKLKKWSKGKSITLVRNEDWWGKNDPLAGQFYKFKRIVYKPVKDKTLRQAMLERGKLDYDNRVRAENFVKKMTSKEWGTKVLKVQAKNRIPKFLSFIGLNNNHKILKDKKVRQALSHLVNVNFLIEKFQYGLQEPATGPFRLASDYSNKNVKPRKFNPEKAKKLLQEAGWADTDKDGLLDKMIDGQKTKFSFELMNPNKDSEKQVTVIKEDMRKAGVDMKINIVDWTAFSKALNERKFDAVIMAWGGGSFEPDPNQIWHSNSAKGTGSNFVSYKNPDVDKLIAKGVNTLDRAERLKIYHKIHAMIAEDTPYIFLYEPSHELYAVSARVQRPQDTLVYSVGPQTWSLPD